MVKKIAPPMLQQRGRRGC